MHTPTGAGGFPRKDTEEDATYIVPKHGGQGKNIFGGRASLPGLRVETNEEVTYVGGNRQEAFNTGIQNRDPRDVTAEITYVAGATHNLKPDTGTFAEIRAPEEIILETCPRMFSKNEEIIKEEIEDSTNELSAAKPQPVEAPEEDKNTEMLDKIIAKESTNLQWAKLILNFLMLTILIVVLVLRGPGKEPSIIGVKACEGPDFLFLLLIVVSAALLTFIAIKNVGEEYADKKEAGYVFVRGDLEFTAGTNTKLILIGFIGALLATAVGLGPGAVFTPVMIQLEMHTAVASSTGMYLTMFTTIAATVNMLAIKQINVAYMLILCGVTPIGSIIGIVMQPIIRRKLGGRTQFMVAILISALVLIVATITPYMVYEAVAAKNIDQTEDVTAFKSYC